MWLQKSQFLNSLVNWQKFGSATQAYIKKENNFLSFSKIGKNWEVQLEQYSEILNSFCQMGNLGSTANNKKITILNLRMNWENFCPNNLSFTLKIKYVIYTK